MIRLVHRPARSLAPVLAEEPKAISPPPTLPDGRSGGGLASLLPLAGAGVAMSMMMFLRGSGFAALGAVVLVVALAAAAAMFVTQRGQAARKRRAQRELYVAHLEDLREELLAHEAEFRRESVRRDPPTAHLLDVVADPARLWERRRADVDFLRLRVGTGALPVRELVLRDEGTVTAPTDPFMLSEARALVRRFGRLPELPLRVHLDRAGDVSVVGAARADVLAVARVLIAQLAAFHAPDDVRLVVVAPAAAEPEWGWVRWLPHLLDTGRIGPAGPSPLLVEDMAALQALLADDLAGRARAAAVTQRYGGGATEARTRPRLLVVDDAHGRVARHLAVPDPAVGPAAAGITVVHLLADRLHEPGEVTRRLEVDGGRVVLTDRTTTPATVLDGTVDEVPAPLVEALARRVAPLRLAPDSYDDGSGTPPADFATLLRLDEPGALDLERSWRPRGERDLLRVPIGVDPAGRPVVLDLKESAQLGMGPHGLCVGATGSGKSELLRTLVLGLVVAHPPSELAMVLVDYKGGATFAPFGALPHVAGLITNLSGDAALVERMYASLDGEVLRRQQLLADAGRATDVVEYRMRRAEHPELPGLPHLLVVIDEFGELLTAKPEFAELFLRIGRIGRSIGVHLLLSSQRIEQGKLRGLETYLSYRIGLRTLSEVESRTVLDTPDAARLPALPGHGYLKVDVTVYQQFKTAYVSGPLRTGPVEEAPPAPEVRPMLRFGVPPSAAGPGPEALPTATRRTTGPTLLSTVVDQLAAAAPPVAPVWLVPLPAAVALDRAAGGVVSTAAGPRLTAAPPSSGDRLVVPLGVLDDPARQWQGPWLVDLSAGGGNLLVVGGPGSGRSTALRTLALGLACTRTPDEVAVYGIDLLGSGLRGLAGLPHVGGVTGRDDRERVRRTVDEVRAALLGREHAFSRLGLDGVADLRAARSAGRAPGIASDEVVLLVDGWGELSAEFEDVAPGLHDLVARGGRFGVHVVATARRSGEVRAAQQVAFARRIELRLADPGESAIDGKLARAVPADLPGRALTPERCYAQVALPRLDGRPDPAAAAGLERAAALVRGAWTGPLPPPVRVLPAVLPAREIETGTGPVPFGVFETDGSAAVLDLDGRDQHLLVLGDPGTGKTNLLRLLARALVRRHPPEELVFAVVDPRGGLADVVPDPWLGGYAPNPVLATRLAAAVAGQLAERGGVRGGAPRVVVLVDDHDVLGAAGTQPLAPLVPHLAGGRDAGLHVLMTRKVLGASRGLYEPFTLGVRESGCLSLVLSGDRSEGQLVGGVRAEALPVGRGRLVRLGERPRIVQTAIVDGTEDAGEVR